MDLSPDPSGVSLQNPVQTYSVRPNLSFRVGPSPPELLSGTRLGTEKNGVENFLSLTLKDIPNLLNIQVANHSLCKEFLIVVSSNDSRHRVSVCLPSRPCGSDPPVSRTQT